MLPLECHYVAEIRYQEHVAAVRPPDGGRVRSIWPLLRQSSCRPSLFALFRGWLKLDGRPIRVATARDRLV
jgi:hypothetical protein